MEYYIVIDTGTSNTRIRLLNEKKEIIDNWESNTGVRVTAIEGNNDRLKTVIRQGIREIVDRNSVDKTKIKKILASGMITSNVGLVEVPHITAPAGHYELKDHVKELLIKDVADIPISFVPGVKNNIPKVTLDNFEAMDIMRGEEAEVMAIQKSMAIGNDTVIVLPGSHNKFVGINKSGKITGCMTTLSGELLECISKSTIIADSVNHRFADTYDKSTILLGYHTALKVGLTRAVFSGRILSQFVLQDANMIANYLLGAVLQSDMKALKGTDAIHIDSNSVIIVAGKEGLRKALVDVIKEEMPYNVVKEYPYDKYMSAKGVFSLFEE